MRPQLLIFFGFALLINVSVGQSIKDTHCATMEMDSINRAKFPQRGTLSDFEEMIQSKIQEIRNKRNGGRTQATIISLPIIVHVVHNGEAPGTGTNLSKAQVQSQIDVLNEDFRKKAGTPGGASNNPIAADIEIEFCLSPLGENGETLLEPGIHRYNSNRSDWSRDLIENQLKPTTIWDPNLFYNIWTVKFASSDANLIGYAQFPDQSGLSGLNVTGGPGSTDGVVIRYQSFGSTDKGNFPVMVAPYNKGRTLAHETGHWLGLRHIWGDGGCEASDFVDDTPPAAGSSSGCSIGRVSCGGTNMVENYMDYSDDQCMNIFTVGQKVRMRAVMEVSPRRKSLIEANLCTPAPPAPPVAALEVDNQSCVLLGSAVTFIDRSTNFPTEWHWAFEGGDPSVSTEKNPTIRYQAAGTYSVSLWTANSLGKSDTLVLDDFIVVTPDGVCREFNNYKETYTPSLTKLSEFGNYSGYLTGHNSLKSKGLAEFFANECGYLYISGLNIRFGKSYTLKEDATVNFVVWNARGGQYAPGSVIERKTVSFKQIQEDIANNEPTAIVFDRETPIFGKPFQVGIELEYKGDTLAIISSADGEATEATSWIKDVNGVWSPISIAFGANVAMDIQPIVGMNPSVQVSASDILAFPGQEIVMNGRGASIFVWNASDGSVVNYTGPQLIVSPLETTTYTIKGSGLELCNSTASFTIYVSDKITQVPEISMEESLALYPNPGRKNLNVRFVDQLTGLVEMNIYNLAGTKMNQIIKEKKDFLFDERIEVTNTPPGVYMIEVSLGNKRMVKKWISLP